MSLRRRGKQKPIKEGETGREGKVTLKKKKRKCPGNIFPSYCIFFKAFRQKIENVVGQRSSAGRKDEFVVT